MMVIKVKKRRGMMMMMTMMTMTTKMKKKMKMMVTKRKKMRRVRAMRWTGAERGGRERERERVFFHPKEDMGVLLIFKHLASSFPFFFLVLLTFFFFPLPLMLNWFGSSVDRGFVPPSRARDRLSNVFCDARGGGRSTGPWMEHV